MNGSTTSAEIGWWSLSVEDLVESAEVSLARQRHISIRKVPVQEAKWVMMLSKSRPLDIVLRRASKSTPSVCQHSAV